MQSAEAVTRKADPRIDKSGAILRLHFGHFIGVLTVIATPALADCQTARPDAVALLTNQRPLIEAAINGKPLRMVVDTGAERSSVTPETATAFGLPRDLRQRTLTKTVGGQKLSENTFLEQLTVAKYTYLDMSVAVLALRGAATEPHPAGLIGADLLQDFDIELDIPRRKLILYRIADCKLSGPSWDGRYQTIAARVSDHHQFLFPVKLNGHSLTAVFDTGARGGLVTRAAAESIGISDAQLEKDPSSTGTGAGLQGFAERRHRFDTFTIGEETFRNMPLGVAEFRLAGADMLVGIGYMQRRRFFLSYSTGTLFVQSEFNAPSRPDTLPSLQANGAQDGCRPPPDILPSLAHDRLVILSRPRMGMPAAVQTDHIAGCAGVMFRLAADGTPIDLKLVTENPTGYGLGDFVIREIAAAKFQPYPAESNWHYEVHRFHPPRDQ